MSMMAVKSAIATVGVAIISKGVDFVNNGQLSEGVICVGVGFGLILVSYILQEKQAAEKAVKKVLKLLGK